MRTVESKVVAALCSVALVTGVSNATAGAAAPGAVSADVVAAGGLSASGGAISYLPTGSRARVERVRATVGDLRSGIAHDSYLAKMLATMTASGAQPPAVPALPVPTARQREQTSSLPAPLQAPVAGLYAAVRQAAATLGTIPSRDIRAAWTHTLRQSAVGDRTPRFAVQRKIMQRSGRAVTMGVQAPDRQRRFTTPAIHRAAVHSPAASLLIAGALDTYLPSITAGARTSPAPPGVRAAGCDQLDLTPYLCVGTSADNTYAADEMLLIDLGGNDTYANTAGGAPFAPSGAPGLVPVSVNVDLAGDDRYQASGAKAIGVTGETMDPSLRALMVQGAGVWGGAGVLVDRSGNDSYSAIGGPGPLCPGDDQSDCLSRAAVVSQGAAREGAGWLFDRAGADTYRTDAFAIPANVRAGVAMVIAQGSEYNFDVVTPSGLFDEGAGKDRYSVVAAQSATSPEAASYEIYAQGVGNTFPGQPGLGVLYDDGGDDAFTIAANPRQTKQPRFRYDDPYVGFFVVGQGAGMHGQGFLLTGTGNTSYTLDVDGEGAVFLQAFAEQGSAYSPGIGVLDDLGGDDTYVARTRVVSDVALSVGDDCTTDRGVRCPHAEAAVDMGLCDGNVSCTISNELAAQGSRTVGGFGLLEDHKGDDRYDAQSLENLAVSLHDRLSNPDQPPTLEVLSYMPAMLDAQGAATGGNGVAVLLDHAGTDTYVARSSNRTSASATSDHAVGDPIVTAAAQHGVSRLFTGGQGAQEGGSAGVAALIDLEGVGDSFTATSDAPLTVSPHRVVHDAGYEWPGFHGSSVGGSGTSIFVARGQSPSIFSSPARPTCTPSDGPRGSVSWLDCVAWGDDAAHTDVDSPGGAGRGMAPGSSGTAPTVFIGPSTTTSAQAGSVIPVDVGLVAADGTPLAGRPVRIDLQFKGVCGAACVPESQWFNVSEAEGVTGSEGSVRLWLPVTLSWDGTPTTYKLYASFDGAPEAHLYPAFGQAPIAVTTQ
jgi:hypothetical protein